MFNGRPYRLDRSAIAKHHIQNLVFACIGGQQGEHNYRPESASTCLLVTPRQTARSTS
jgi:hypothetical protein